MSQGDIKKLLGAVAYNYPWSGGGEGLGGNYPCARHRPNGPYKGLPCPSQRRGVYSHLLN